MFLSSSSSPQLIIAFWILWTLGILGFNQSDQHWNRNFQVRGYTNDSSSVRHTTPELRKSDSQPLISNLAFGQDNFKNESQGKPLPLSSKSKRQKLETKPLSEDGTGANATVTEEKEESKEPDTCLLQFKWITYLLLFAIINLVILLIIGLGFVVYYITKEKCSKKDKGGGNDCGETDDCSCGESDECGSGGGWD
ncbi:hypothetical protein V9T40_001797 [Parthenolecanium corni]|uniref:Uncharacterized protein n=1 Tax=Parthenolecanium corni TaxID=536013 RepID=A0AAN9TH82_9HEMI